MKDALGYDLLTGYRVMDDRFRLCVYFYAITKGEIDPLSGGRTSISSADILARFKCLCSFYSLIKSSPIENYWDSLSISQIKRSLLKRVYD